MGPTIDVAQSADGMPPPLFVRREWFCEFKERGMSVHDAVTGDIHVDKNGKLWRCIGTCKEPTVVEMMGKLVMPMIFIAVSMVLVQLSNALIEGSDPSRGAGVGYLAGMFEGAAVALILGRLIAWWRERRRSRAAASTVARLASTAATIESGPQDPEAGEYVTPAPTLRGYISPR
jgi:hypothetical protein